MLLAVIANNKDTVLKLAKDADVLHAIIKELGLDNLQNLTLTTFAKIVDKLSYHILIEPKLKF